jgi:acetylornithine deacetylase/succinyl-diaminopimelate desuccinylase-like protein
MSAGSPSSAAPSRRGRRPPAGGAAGPAARAAPARAAVRELAELVAIPSVSSDPARAADVRRAARWVAARCRRAGFASVEEVPGRRHQVVVARAPGPARAPTVLLYAHYDVQPAGPAAAWRHPPFRPVVRGGRLHGRGSTDDKGPLLCLIAAVERLLRRGPLPVGVVLVADGEEEVGSPTLPHLLAERLPRWQPSAAIVCDTRMLGPGRPALTVGLRGSLALELTVEGAPADLHSGQFGGAVRNPLQVVCEIVAALHDRDGRIAVPGLYDGVRPVARRPGPPPRPDADILREAGVRHGWGERGFGAYDRVTARPSLTVAGVTGGHHGAGVPSVIPARAGAKLSLRLVPDQDPARVERLVRERIAALVPPGVRHGVRRHSAGAPVLLDARDDAHRAVARAVRSVWGVAPAVLRSGGSIPLAHLLAVTHAVPTVLTGFALPDDGAHGPNERFRVEHLELGTRTIARALHELGGGGGF